MKNDDIGDHFREAWNIESTFFLQLIALKRELKLSFMLVTRMKKECLHLECLGRKNKKVHLECLPEKKTILILVKFC